MISTRTPYQQLQKTQMPTYKRDENKTQTTQTLQAYKQGNSKTLNKQTVQTFHFLRKRIHILHFACIYRMQVARFYSKFI